MPTLPCPNCGAPTARQMNLTGGAYVNYYRCEACTHIWTTDKQTNEVLDHVTPLRAANPSQKPS